MAISLTGMASGLDTESIISQLMQIEQTKVTAVQKRQVSVNQHKTDLQMVKSKLDAFKTAATDLGSRLAVEGEAGHDVLGPDEGRSHRARRRRHRRPVDPGRPPRVLRAARLQLHGRLQRGQDRLHQRQHDRCRSTSRPTPPPPTSPRPSTVTTAPRCTRPSSRTAASTSSSSPRARPARTRTSRVDTSQLGAGTVLNEDSAYTRTGATLNASIKVNGGAEQNPESNVLETIIPGVRLTLKGITASPATVSTTSPAVDQDAITKKVTALVEAYNAVVTFTRLGAQREEGARRRDERGPAEGPAVRRLEHERHAAPAQDADDADPERPRAHRPRRSRHRRSPSPRVARPPRTPRTAS